MSIEQRNYTEVNYDGLSPETRQLMREQNGNDFEDHQAQNQPIVQSHLLDNMTNKELSDIKQGTNSSEKPIAREVKANIEGRLTRAWFKR